MTTKTERLNLYFPPELSKKLNEYVLALSKKQNRETFGVKTAICRKAIDEWLENHQNDFDIDIL
ncbi:MAG: hypothetical protein ACQCN4_11830 [Candidatus Bathyarchaeia archaeon]|jgi:hypothetical protein